LGFIGLVAAAIATELTALLYLSGLWKKREKLIRYADLGVVGVCAILTITSTILIYLLVSQDFQTIYVAQNTSRDLPLLYVISAFWAGQEGSLLFWAWLISIFNALIVLRSRKDDALKPYVATTLILVQMFFQIVLLFASNPFARYDFVPADGYGLNPLLQDPGMVFHPPILFIGYAAVMVPFAYAMAGLLKEDENWVYRVRGWNMLSWLTLTLGIALGGWWSYHMLGWGGYWAWDPVENSSLMPWLTLTAFMHSVMIQEGKRGMKLWNMLLPTFTFLLVIYATFLTRSGIIQSIHSFSESSIGIYFISFILLTLIASLGLIASKYGSLKSRNIFEDYVSKETSFLFNNLLFTTLTLLILLGTTFPMLSEAVRGYQVRVGPGYFNETFTPIALILAILMGLCPLIAWRKASLQSLRRNLTFPLASTFFLVAASFALGVGDVKTLVVVSSVVFNISALVQEFYRASEPESGESWAGRIRLLGSAVKGNQRRYGGYLIHLSIIIMLAGVASSTINEETKMVTLDLGERFDMGDYAFVLNDITSRDDGIKHVNQVQVDIYVNGKLAHEARPAIDYYYKNEQTIRHPYIHTIQLIDIYLIYEYSTGSSATFTFKTIPHVNLIWAGTVLGILGVMVAAWPRKLSILKGGVR